MMPLPLWFKGLTPELSKKAAEELGETADVKKKALIEFKHLIEEQHDIKCRTDDSFLLRFLRVKKFDTQKAFRTFRNYHEFRTKHSGVFTCLKPSDVRNVIDMNIINYVSYRVSDGSHVAMFRLGKLDTNVVKLEDLVATVLICGELIFECEATQICGGILIIDFLNISLQHYAMFLNLSFVKFTINTFQDCWPDRVKGIHFVNQPAALTAIYHLVKPFVKKKLLQRVHFHGSKLESLHEFVPKELLPEELGGTMGPFNNKEFASYFYSQESFISNINQYGIIKT
ncbi:clavesin-1 [Parasteatoda tepidariorum]|uniref:clavesin-1 n=1 Tax=Parasteatoda tepidariorum TaxID=114398 RepID=UPI00077F8699|nr:clavesin-1 [Parasteatoda tepidariorum]